MFPISDANPTRRLPILTYVLIAINVLVFLWELTLTQAQLDQAFLNLAVVPANVTRHFFAPETVFDIVRSMFLHGGWDHILGNMLYLYLFGDNVEDRLGKIGFLILYFVSGFAAAFAQVLIDPTSQAPLIGASGAIAGVLGGYLLLYPSVKVRGIVPLGGISSIAEWPAFIVLGMWFVLQLVNGFASLGGDASYGGGVAFFAHIGGFIVGLVITFIITRFVPQPPADQRVNMLYRRAQR
ncbi:MAG: rhomboid family intramembrane serine protease [Chloroflexota bacterium]